MESVEVVKKDDKIFAVILRKSYSEPGVRFFTPDEFSQQLGMLVHPKGKVVKRHRHRLMMRNILMTQEVLFLLEGKIQVDLFGDEGEELASVALAPGDTILLAQGGHRVEVLEDARIIEIKQGPYSGTDEKEFF